MFEVIGWLKRLGHAEVEDSLIRVRLQGDKKTQAHLSRPPHASARPAAMRRPRPPPPTLTPTPTPKHSQLVSYLKSLAFELGELGYAEPLTVPSSVMLACYDGEGAFYKPHMDSATTDPRRLTAIVYLVPPDWDAAADADGGKLLWWRVRPDFEEDGERPAKREVAATTSHNLTFITTQRPHPYTQVAPREGRLVLFRARTVKHEVLPTHRKRFAVTLCAPATRRPRARLPTLHSLTAAALSCGARRVLSRARGRARGAARGDGHEAAAGD